jgi:activating signal cointegrator 1
MRVIALHQPWAELITKGLKHYETRHWGTNYRGKIAIHAGKKEMDFQAREIYTKICHTGSQLTQFDRIAYGSIVAIADLANIYLIDKSLSVSPIERLAGNWEYGRFAWHLVNVIALPNPIPCRGQQGLKPLPVDLCDRLLKEVEHGL